MRKKILKVAVLLFITSFAFASTLEVKTQELFKKDNFILSKESVKDKNITICYEISRTEREINEFVIEVTTTYMCFTSPTLGTGTVYMPAAEKE